MLELVFILQLYLAPGVAPATALFNRSLGIRLPRFKYCALKDDEMIIKGTVQKEKIMQYADLLHIDNIMCY